MMILIIMGIAVRTRAEVAQVGKFFLDIAFAPFFYLIFCYLSDQYDWLGE